MSSKIEEMRRKYPRHLSVLEGREAEDRKYEGREYEGEEGEHRMLRELGVEGDI